MSISSTTFTEAQPVRESRAARRARQEAGLPAETVEVQVTEWTIDGVIDRIELGQFAVVIVGDARIQMGLGEAADARTSRLFQVGDRVRMVTRERREDGLFEGHRYDDAALMHVDA
ncbi:hypothetical protein J2Y69_002151 [Microbacterium resistens]|uniref:Uncharacterized protein n=1 Tax=Microbacterium resistens TaxID=156977 RepID=A0ABU1SF98_9MICO|nr:hypothetical protein [Microbacterium resistens]MDR6867547.1 hypothetical protein [Microbacterium resistens]